MRDWDTARHQREGAQDSSQPARQGAELHLFTPYTTPYNRYASLRTLTKMTEGRSRETGGFANGNSVKNRAPDKHASACQY